MQRLRVEFARRFIARSRHDSNDRHRRRVFVRCLVVVDVLSNGIFSRKIFLREGLVDDDRARVALFAQANLPDQIRDLEESAFPLHGSSQATPALTSAGGFCPGGMGGVPVT